MLDSRLKKVLKEKDAKPVNLDKKKKRRNKRQKQKTLKGDVEEDQRRKKLNNITQETANFGNTL